MIINLTPHTINVIGHDPILPSGTVARLSTMPVVTGHIDGIPVTKTVFGDTVDLPDQIDGTWLIVSAIVRMAHPDRTDLLSPGQQVRDDQGRVVGCKSLDGGL